jgi:hypothetical protein
MIDIINVIILGYLDFNKKYKNKKNKKIKIKIKIKIKKNALHN